MLDFEKQHNMNNTNGNTSNWVNYLLAKKEYCINGEYDTCGVVEEMNFIESYDPYKKLQQKYCVYNFCTYCILQHVIL